MRYLMIASVALIVACSTASDQTKSTVEVYRADRQVGSFIAGNHRYEASDRPAVVTWLRDPGGQSREEPNDERIIAGVKVTGWQEGAATRVQAYVLMTRDKFGNFNLHNEGLLTPRLVGDYRLRIGERASITRLQFYQVEPMEIRIAPAPPPS